MDNIEAIKCYMEAFAAAKRQNGVFSTAAVGMQIQQRCAQPNLQEKSQRMRTDDPIPTKRTNLVLDESSFQQVTIMGSSSSSSSSNSSNMKEKICRATASEKDSENNTTEYASPLDKIQSRRSPYRNETMVVTHGPIPTKLVYLCGVDSRKALMVSPFENRACKTRDDRWERMMTQLQKSGVLTAAGKTPGQLPISFRPSHFDVVLTGDEYHSIGVVHHNTEFEKLIFCCVSTFQIAVEAKSNSDAMNLVQGIVAAVDVKGGRFLLPIIMSSGECPQLWCEVSRNLAERFALRELRMACMAQTCVQTKRGTCMGSQQLLSMQDKQYSTVNSTFLRRNTLVANSLPVASTLDKPIIMTATSTKWVKKSRRITPADIDFSPNSLSLEESGQSTIAPLALLSEAASQAGEIKSGDALKRKTVEGKSDTSSSDTQQQASKQRRISA